MGGAEVTRFLSALAVQRNVAASTQNQAPSALDFLYRAVLQQELPWLDDIVRAKAQERIPVVLTRAEVYTVVDGLDGPPRLVALLLYGAGLRLLETLRLPVKDVDFPNLSAPRERAAPPPPPARNRAAARGARRRTQ